MAKESLDYVALLDMLQAESDRGCLLAGCALIETLLGDLLAAHFKRRSGVSRGKINDLLGVMKPLGSFAARLRACEALGILEADIATAIDTIREIRNRFAHGAQPVQFTPQHVAAIEQKLDAKVVAEIARTLEPLRRYELEIPQEQRAPQMYSASLAKSKISAYLAMLCLHIQRRAESELNPTPPDQQPPRQ